MSITINELKVGVGLKIDNNIYVVLSINHVKPGKGSAFVRVRIRNITTDQVLERTFKSAEKLDEADLEERRLQYSYDAGDHLNFMDLSSYEEVSIPKAIIAEDINFLQEYMEIVGVCYKNKFLKVILPNFIIAEVKETDPGLKGDTAKSAGKPATIDTGAVVQVPLFIEVGDKLKIDTRSGDYVERMKQ